MNVWNQRLLWASTSKKNPAYSDTQYVDPLIGPDTINTLPIVALNVYRDHGTPQITLDKNSKQAYQMLQALSRIGIDLDQLTQQLEDQGVEKFQAAPDRLTTSLQKEQAAILASV